LNRDEKGIGSGILNWQEKVPLGEGGLGGLTKTLIRITLIYLSRLNGFLTFWTASGPPTIREVFAIN